MRQAHKVAQQGTKAKKKDNTDFLGGPVTPENGV